MQSNQKTQKRRTFIAGTVVLATLALTALVGCGDYAPPQGLDSDAVLEIADSVADVIIEHSQRGVITINQVGSNLIVDIVNDELGISAQRTIPLSGLPDEMHGISVPELLTQLDSLYQLGDLAEMIMDGDIATQRSALTTGCFGYDWCVRIDDPTRCVLQIPANGGDVVIYGDSDAAEPPTGVVYTNNVNYVPFGTPANHNAMFGLLTAYGHGAMDARNARCASPVFKAQCYQEEEK